MRAITIGVLSAITAVCWALAIFAQGDGMPQLLAIGLLSGIAAILVTLLSGPNVKSTAEIHDEMAAVVAKVWSSRDAVMPQSKGLSIMGRDGLSSYSTADEMIKWKKLFDEGVVSEEEYQDAVDKIMKRK